MKLLLAFLHYGPYHHARLSAAAEAGRTAGITVTGLGMAHTQGEYAWTTGGHDDLPAELLCASTTLPLEEVPSAQWSTLLGAALNSVAPDVCAVAGYSHPAMLSLISLCAKRKIPWVLMSDSQEIDEIRRPWLEWMKSRLIRLASSGLVAGKPHIDYLDKLGLPESECEVGYDVVDNDYFARESRKFRLSPDPSAPYFLASARFIAKKNLFRLLDAYARYSLPNRERSTGNEEPAPCPLCLLGDGELKSDLLTHAESLGLTVIESAPWETKYQEPGTGSRPQVYFPGFRQIEELPRFYAHARVFVHASTTEQWGLVVNEAMACGLPVLVSNRCGCAPDLVEEGVNGFTFDPGNVDALSSLMTRMADMSESEQISFGAASQRIIADWGPERFASGLKAAAEKALDAGPKPAGFLDRLLLTGLIRLSSLRS